MYKIYTYKAASGIGFVARIEWQSLPGVASFPGDIQFGFASLRSARKWANARLRDLRGLHCKQHAKMFEK